MMNSNSKTFCPLPWMHLHMHTNGDINPCCVSKESVANINKESTKDALNNEKMKKLRYEMMNNIEPASCNYCFDKEKLGYRSYRNWISEKYGNNIEKSLETTSADGTLNDFNISYIDFRFSNLCNFKCRSCKSEFSSALAIEEEKVFSINHPAHLKAGETKKVAYEEFKKYYPTLKHIYFAGGEPLMQWEHWQILKDLTESGKSAEIELTYSTNASLILSRNGEVFNYWKLFKSLSVCLSIDAIGKEAEYWRNGTSWKNIEDTIIKLKEFKKNNSFFSYYIISTISWPNVSSWIKLIKHCLEHKYIDNPDGFTYSTVDSPEELSLHSLPEFKKQQVLKELEEFKTYLNSFFGDDTGTKKIEFITNFIFNKSTPEELKKYSKQMTLDKVRKESFFEVFPEHEDMRQYIFEASKI